MDLEIQREVIQNLEFGIRRKGGREKGREEEKEGFFLKFFISYNSNAGNEVKKIPKYTF